MRGRNQTLAAFPWGFLPLRCVEMEPGSAQEMGLSSTYLSQISIREALQVLLETTDMNCVLVPGGHRGQNDKTSTEHSCLGCF